MKLKKITAMIRTEMLEQVKMYPVSPMWTN